MRNSSPGQELTEEMPSELSFDQQHGSTEVLNYQSSIITPDLFDVFVVDVEGDLEGERRGRSLVEQFDDDMNYK